MRLFFRVCVAALAGSLAAWPSAQSGGQAPPPPAEQRSTFRADANFVRVDAYPMKGGHPVLDLVAADFEVFEDGAPQNVASFEHVVVRPAGAQSERIEPSSGREMLQAAANPRTRVFVIFLDGPHVGVTGSHDIAEPLLRLINRILGPDDLVGIMTPAMSASQIVLARRTEVTEEQLRKHWTWGERFSFARDSRERDYADCYPVMSTESGVESALAKQMVARKRERMTLEALEDLVRYLTAIREERKGILTVTEGWALFKPDDSLTKLRTDANTGAQDPIPGVDPVGVGPDGKLTTKDPRNFRPTSKMDCDADRMRLAAMDNEEFLRDIINQANRGNASFYPIDPRGLPVFDTPIDQALPPVADARALRTRQDSMRTLAGATDGLAVMNSNDLDAGLKRIADDLTSYYLLGYYSTNTRLDGSYRALKVRVKRPGVEVRSRRGYRAASAEEIARAKLAAAAPNVNAATPISSALDMLALVRPEARLRLHATTAPGSDLLWIAGELSPAAGRNGEWTAGATTDLQVVVDGTTTASRVSVKPGEHAFLTPVKLPPGQRRRIEVQARATAAAGGEPATERLSVAAAAQPLFFRRGPTTANRQVATADLRFTRAERVHLELPITADARPGAGRLLDRSGQPLPVPVTISERTDAETGQRWLTADLALAPLAPADYVVEMATTENGVEARMVAGVRVVR